MVYYVSRVNEGLISASSGGDGYTITIKWTKAYPSKNTNKVAYHIYMATKEDNVFSEGIKFVSIDGYTKADIFELDPGQLYHFAVRAVEYDPNIIDPSLLPSTFSNLRAYPESLLRANINETAIIIPLIDVSTFPSFGIIKAGVELINYLSIDSFNNNLVLTNSTLQRGFLNTVPAIHNTDGYDGYHTWNPLIQFLIGKEELNTRIFPCQSRFEFDTNAFTLLDGYKQVTKDLLTSDMSASDEANQDFPGYDYSGYHRTDPVQLLTGECVGSYIGGEFGCIDEYGNVQIYRGLNLQDVNNQRQEMLLSLTGRPAVLIQRMRTGIPCSCYLPSSEYQDDRCINCHGSKFVVGFTQFFNPRRSDGRILVRQGPADEDVKMNDAGLESEFSLDMWTLTVPTIKDRDYIVLFDQNDNEEYRYEVMSVQRNNTLIGQFGGQKFRVQRVRKTDPIYQVRIFRNSSNFPTTIQTQLGSTTNIPPHTHSIVVNEGITSITQINQTTGVSFAHSHSVVDGIIQPALNHNHAIIL